MSKKTILVVDDESDLLDLIEYNLTKENFAVIKASDGLKGIKKAKEHKPDLVLLDIMMPKLNGLEVCDMMRSDSDLKHIPIIFLTARSDERTEVEGLNAGADDYITKPISTVKLVSHIKAVLRRSDSTIDNNYQKIVIHDLIIDREGYKVFFKGDELNLPRKEFDLLYYLASRKGKVLSRQNLLNNVWGENVHVVDRTVDVHIRKIREKLGSEYVDTVKGVGYRFRDDRTS